MKHLDIKMKQASYTLFMTIVVLSAILLINIISESLDLKFDMTDKGLFSLSEETDAILENLDKDVEILALYKPGRESKEILTVLDLYDDYERVSVQILDPDRNPALLSRYGKEEETIPHGSLVIKSGSYWRVINEIDLYDINYSQSGPRVFGMKVDQQVTSAIAYVITGRIPKVYEIRGHMEFSLFQTGIDAEIEKSNFELAELNITRSSGIPADADILILNGPKRDFTEYEKDKLANYLERGGKLFAAIGYVENEMPNLYSLLRSYDLDVNNGLVMESNTNRLMPEFGDNPFFFAPYMAEHAITDLVQKSRLDPFFSGSVGLGRHEPHKRNILFNPLLTSSDNSRLRMDMSSESHSLSSTDRPGPLNVAVAISERDPDSGEESGARLVVSGSSMAFTPIQGLGILPGNVKFLLGSLTWLDNDKSTVSISSKLIFDLPLQIDTQRALIYGAIVTVLIPLIIIGTAIIIYRKRKNL